MNIEKLKANKKILILLAFLVVASTIFFAFGEDIQDWRQFLDDQEEFGISQSKSQMKVEIIRNGVVLDPFLSSTLTNKLDIVDTPPTINAVVGDTIRITDISYAPEPKVLGTGAWDFQTYKNGIPFHS